MRFGAEKPTASGNRAEDVRRRRAQRSQQRSSVVSSRITNPVNTRPVTVRGNVFGGTPVHRQVGTRARRQFYLTVDQAAGTELRLPAIRLVNPGWRLISGIIAIAAIIGIFSMWSSPYFQVQSVDVKGLQRLTAEDINANLKLEEMSIIEVNASEIHDQLVRAFPELIDAQVSVELPNLVTITATERQPVMAVKKGDTVSWIDPSGIIFPARGDAGPLVTIATEDNLPLAPILNPPADATTTDGASADASTITNVKNASKIPDTGLRPVDPALILAAQSLAQKLPPDTQLVYSAKDGLGWTDPQGWQVFIGADLSNFEEKYTLYQKIATYLSDNGLKAKLVSVEHLDAPFYRLEQ